MLHRLNRTCKRLGSPTIYGLVKGPLNKLRESLIMKAEIRKVAGSGLKRIRTRLEETGLAFLVTLSEWEDKRIRSRSSLLLLRYLSPSWIEELRWNMDKGKAVMGAGRRWAVDFSDQSTVPSSRDILDPPGFSRAPPEQVLILNFNLKLTCNCYCIDIVIRMIQQRAAKRKTLKLIGNFRLLNLKSQSLIL